MLIRRINLKTSVIRIEGDLTGAMEYPLMQTIQQATKQGTMYLILDLRSLNYMNSAGIGVLIALIDWAHKNRQHLLGFGLSAHYRQILALTELDRRLRLYPGEREAIAATHKMPIEQVQDAHRNGLVTEAT